MGFLGGGGGIGAVATYSLASSVTAADESKSITITLTTTNVGNNTDVGYTISGVTTSDFAVKGSKAGILPYGTDLGSGIVPQTSLTGNFNVVNNTASITFGILADSATEGAETFTITITGQTATTSVSINDISTASYTRLANGSRIAGNAGPGGVYDAYGYLMPLKGKALGIINNTGKDMFIPTKTQAEMTALYNNLNVSGVTVVKGDYISQGRIWKNQVAWTAGPCYNYISTDGYGNYVPLAQTAPPAVDSGFIDGGIVSAWTSPLVYQNNNGNINNGDVGWLFYMTTTWGCAAPGYPFLFANIRYGYVEF